jgi:transposase InsO family protein
VKRPKLTSADGFLWAQLSQFWGGWRSALVIVKPETVIGWHRKAFRLFWTWKVRHGQPGRPPLSQETRQLIRKMCRENPPWGAPRIHGELLKLGIDIGETTVSKYLIRCDKPPSQNWRTFLDNHVRTMVSVDFFTVPTVRFQTLYVFLVLAHERRRILHFGVTAHPTAEWTAQQLREAFPWETAPRSPWQRAYVERVIGTLRRECLDHVIVFSEARFVLPPCERSAVPLFRFALRSERLFSTENQHLRFRIAQSGLGMHQEIEPRRHIALLHL